MKPLAKEWELFHTKTYPRGMHPAQHRQIWQSFLAGVWVTLKLVKGAGRLTEDEGVKYLEDLEGECSQAIEDIIKRSASRN